MGYNQYERRLINSSMSEDIGLIPEEMETHYSKRVPDIKEVDSLPKALCTGRGQGLVAYVDDPARKLAPNEVEPKPARRAG